VYARTSAAVRAIGTLQRWLYESMDLIIVIGRDMEALIADRLRGSGKAPLWIPNWADVDAIRPEAKAGNLLLSTLGIGYKFVVQYSGNMGRTHGLESVLDTAELLRSDDRIHFLLIGTGAKRPWLERSAAERGLTNVTILPYQPRDRLRISLNACDVGIISFAPGMAGVSVPSRMYNILASGKPIIAVADDPSELARLVREEDVGWVVRPGDVGGIAAAIYEAKAVPALLARKGAHARNVAETKYTYERVISSYSSALSEV
jgi:glycosyltransferase involved in cell wall biosynthesis